MWKFFLAFFFLFLAACSVPQQYEGNVVVLEDRLGGNLLEHINERTFLDKSEEQIVIRGRLSSAATIFATVDNACLERGTVLGFHRPTLETNVEEILAALSIIYPQVSFIAGNAPELGVRVIALFLSGEARSMWINKWSKSEDFTRITAEDFVKLEANAKLC